MSAGGLLLETEAAAMLRSPGFRRADHKTRSSARVTLGRVNRLIQLQRWKRLRRLRLIAAESPLMEVTRVCDFIAAAS